MLRQGKSEVKQMPYSDLCLDLYLRMHACKVMIMP